MQAGVAEWQIHPAQMGPLWWNWQTRTTQNRVALQPCRFDSDQRHHLCGTHLK